MPQYITDTALLVRDTLRANWDNTGLAVTLSDSDIHTGWYDDSKGYPQISVTRSDEGVVGGGEAGFTGIRGDGSGVTQLRSGVVLVDVWAGSRDDYDARGREKVQLEQMAETAEKILHTEAASVPEVASVAVTTRTNIADTDSTPTEYRVQLEVTYVWQKTPN